MEKKTVMMVENDETWHIAADIIKNKGLVAFPTETVYGLGALGLYDKTVESVFLAKNREIGNPITLMIGDKTDFYRYSRNLSLEAIRLAEEFWPGALTLIVEAGDSVPDIVTAGTKKVGFRLPLHQGVLQLLRYVGEPLAVPSANISGRPSPTEAEHVFCDLDGRVDMIVDGGKTGSGLESTVVEVIGGEIKILRPGGISREDIERVAQAKADIGEQVSKKHYQPKAEVVLVVGESEKKRKKCIETLVEQNKTKKIALLTQQQIGKHGDIKKEWGYQAGLIAKELFQYLRLADTKGIELIILEGIEKNGLGEAVMNRMEKSSSRIMNS